MNKEQSDALYDVTADYFYLIVFCVVILLCKLTSMYQTSGLALHYDKKNTLMTDFVKQSKIS